MFASRANTTCPKIDDDFPLFDETAVRVHSTEDVRVVCWVGSYWFAFGRGYGLALAR